jgi:hypothetical protein
LGELPFLTGEQGRGPLLLLLFFVSVTIVALWGTWEGTLPANREAILAAEAKRVFEEGVLSPENSTGGVLSPESSTEGVTSPEDSIEGVLSPERSAEDVLSPGSSTEGVPSPGRSAEGMIFGNPPLTLWITGIFYMLLGNNIFAARLTFVLFSLLTCFAVYLAGERIEDLDGAVSNTGDDNQSSDGWKDKAHSMGLMTAAVFAATPLVGRFAPHLNPGILLSFFVTLSILGWLYLPSVKVGYLIWVVGLIGGMASGGSVALLVIPASLLSLAVDRFRRGLWKQWWFIVLTALSVVVGWVVVEYAPAGSWKVSGKPGVWEFIYSLGSISVKNIRELAIHTGRFWIKSLPWSIPALVAAFRIIVLERTGRVNVRTSFFDQALFIFIIIIFLPVAMVRSVNSGATLAAAPIAALFSAREITRWLKNDLERVWSFNRVVTAIFSLLVILLLITPMQLHRFERDDIAEIGRAARGIVSEEQSIGNYRQDRNIQSARLFFYGDRTLDRPVKSPEELKKVAAEEKDKIFLAFVNDVSNLKRDEWFNQRLEIVYGTESLVLFRITEEASKEVEQ